MCAGSYRRIRLLIITLTLYSFLTACTTENTPPAPPPPVQAESIATTDVIVALEPIPRGAEFRASSIGRRSWPANNVPPGMISDEAVTIGKVAQTEIFQGQVIIEAMLTEVSRSGEASFQVPLNGDFSFSDTALHRVRTEQQRVVINTGNIALIIKDTAEAIKDITTLANEQGGYVSASNVYHSGDVPRGNITIRVPAETYEDTLSTLRSIAIRVEREEPKAQDITEEFVDLIARKTNLSAEEAALQGLLAEKERTDSTGEILEIRRELVSTRGQIEQIEGRLQYLTDQSVLSTITVELIPDVLYQPVSVTVWEPQGTAKTAIQDLVAALQTLVDGLIRFAILFVPLVLIALIPLVLIIWLVRAWWKRTVLS